MAQFASGTDLVAFYDARRIAELVADTGVRPDPATVASHAVVTVMLVAASDEIVAAATVGKRYTEAELSGIAGGSGGGGPLLRQLTCHLAFGLIVNRRGLAADDQSKLTPYWRWAQDYLTLLRKGERVLGGVDDVLDAGLPDTVSMAPQVPPMANQPPSIVQSMGRIFGSGPIVDRGRWGFR
jgi:hypothetical protein